VTQAANLIRPSDLSGGNDLSNLAAPPGLPEVASSTNVSVGSNAFRMQGVAFTVTKMGGIAYLLAANGSSITSVQLEIQSVHIEYTLTGAGTAMAAPQGPPRGNKLLNYVHSMCVRFPIDDCIRSVLHDGCCRNVPLLCMAGVSEFSLLPSLPAFRDTRPLFRLLPRLRNCICKSAAQHVVSCSYFMFAV
jgi:hypothetical protein